MVEKKEVDQLAEYTSALGKLKELLCEHGINASTIEKLTLQYDRDDRLYVVGNFVLWIPVSSSRAPSAS